MKDLECKRCKRRTSVDIHPIYKICDECWRSTTKNPFSRGD